MKGKLYFQKSCLYISYFYTENDKITNVNDFMRGKTNTINHNKN